VALETLKQHRMHGGTQSVYAHDAEETACRMEFAVYTPPQAQSGEKLPVLYWLSGLTCTWANFTEKAGAQRYAAEHGVIIVAPDTSPRGVNIPGEDDAYDFGSAAGFYVDSTEEPWAKHYRMYSYITKELPAVINEHFKVDEARAGLFGHSMGGHGALTIAFKNPDKYKSVSAFAPICSPLRCPWGEKALGGYLGENREIWKDYDATELCKSTKWRSPLLVDQGTGDDFLTDQLKPELLKEACASASLSLTLRMQEGYDHSYYFMASFMGDHIAHHAKVLKG